MITEEQDLRCGTLRPSPDYCGVYTILTITSCTLEFGGSYLGRIRNANPAKTMLDRNTMSHR
jgi:hypothetical protein